ncbi:MAG: TIGR03943 family protein [Chamaesiphon sp.]
MSAKSSSLNHTNKRKGKISPYWVLSLLDVLAITAWGVLLLKYWLTGKLNLLIHPDYFWLVITTGVLLVVVGLLKAIQLLQTFRLGVRGSNPPVVQHMTLFPPGWSSTLLLATAILGLVITPQVFASQTAIQRGVTETVTLTRSHPQAFRSSTQPEDRSLVDWVRTLNVYPEPDAYTGQKVKVQGFVVYPPELSAQYLLLSRFVITCCAADAYPVGLPIKLTQDRKAYAPDSWLEVEGKMITETLQDKRQLVIAESSLKAIPEPKNPYYY